MKLLDDFANAVFAAVNNMKEQAEKRHAEVWEGMRDRLEHHGLRDLHIDGGAMKGRVEGASVELTWSKHDDAHRTRFEWSFDTPIDRSAVLRTPNFTERINQVFGGGDGGPRFGDDRVSRFVVTPVIRAQVEQLAESYTLALRGTKMWFARSELSIDGLSEQVAVVGGLVDQWARRHAAIEAIGLHASGKGEWTGAAHGVPLRVVETHRHHHHTTTVYTNLRRKLPVGTVVEKHRKPDREARNRHRLGDFVLDQVLQARSSALDVVHDRLAKEPVRTQLIGLLGTYPKSRLTPDGLAIRLPGAIVDDCEIPAIVELHQALEAP